MSYQIRTISDKSSLRDYFSRDYALHGYAIGDLADDMWSISTFTGLFEGDNLTAVSLVWKGTALPALLIFGNTPHLQHLIHACDEQEVFCMVPEDLLATFQRVYALEANADTLWRMFIDKRTFKPTHLNHTSAVRLQANDLDALKALYTHGQGGPRPDLIESLQSDMLDQRVFIGVKDRDGDLLAVSGTHLAMPKENIAAIGLVYTRPDMRGQGYSQITTSAVIETLFEMGIQNIILNVVKDNHAAIRVYEKLGFLTHCGIVTGVAKKILE